MKHLVSIVISLSLLITSASLNAKNLIASTPVLTLEGAKVIAAAAAKKAKAEKWNVIIVISDAAGDMKYLERMEDVQLASLEIAISKARAAVLYRRPTQVFSEKVIGGGVALPSLPEMIPFSGGIPIKVDGVLIGGVGVSGVKGSQDAEIAQAGINAFLAELAK